ncbi:hypothetical protein F5148DRAFT_690857 [Russula earlei]|uniref:Uncharacterized protein n=1 Tax=Russula earlei TaxID=71964 RepID=A0ACC0TVC2_9AGAM|nr:hypothetical protein F5148DRAFT_690857 [Russula earlei]
MCTPCLSPLLAGQHSCHPVPPLPHAPACELERSIIPLFGASSSSLLSLSVASSLSSCTTEDLGTAAATTTPHGQMAEGSTLDSLTGDSQNFMPLGGRCMADCDWPRNSLLQGYIITPIVRPVTSRLPSCHLPHVPRPRSQELATTERHVPAQPPETTPSTPRARRRRSDPFHLLGFPFICMPVFQAFPVPWLLSCI